jgi:hypothetical protein
VRTKTPLTSHLVSAVISSFLCQSHPITACCVYAITQVPCTVSQTQGRCLTRRWLADVSRPPSRHLQFVCTQGRALPELVRGWLGRRLAECSLWLVRFAPATREAVAAVDSVAAVYVYSLKCQTPPDSVYSLTNNGMPFTGRLVNVADRPVVETTSTSCVPEVVPTQTS